MTLHRVQRTIYGLQNLYFEGGSAVVVYGLRFEFDIKSRVKGLIESWVRIFSRVGGIDIRFK